MTKDTFPGPLFTDLYELTMAAGYFSRQMNAPASFSLFVRPHDKRNYFVAAGLQTVVDALVQFRFRDEEIRWLSDTGRFKPEFIEYLKNLRFTGDMVAMAEGRSSSKMNLCWR